MKLSRIEYVVTLFCLAFSAILFTVADRVIDSEGNTVLTQPYLLVIAIPLWVMVVLYIAHVSIP